MVYEVGIKSYPITLLYIIMKKEERKKEKERKKERKKVRQRQKDRQTDRQTERKKEEKRKKTKHDLLLDFSNFNVFLRFIPACSIFSSGVTQLY